MSINAEGKGDKTEFKWGIMPQAQFVVSYSLHFATVDVGIGPVSTIIFKLDI